MMLTSRGRTVQWWLIQALAVIATLALVGSCVSLIWLGRIQTGREHDRVTSDVSGCQRGNANRQAQSDQIRNVVIHIALYTGATQAETDALVASIEPDLQPIVTHCVDVIPGAPPDTPDFAP